MTRGRKKEEQPVANTVTLRCPDYLDKESQKLFKSLAPKLTRVTTALDCNSLASYCQCFTRWQQAEQEISNKGLVVQSPQGVKANPACKLSDQYLKMVRYWAIELGLTPLSREKMKQPVAAQKEDSELQQYLSG